MRCVLSFASLIVFYNTHVIKWAGSTSYSSACKIQYAILNYVTGKVAIDIQTQNTEGNNTNDKCNIVCAPEDDEMACGFDAKTVNYKLFSNKCTMKAYSKCHGIALFETAAHFCIRNQIYQNKRRAYGESCPVFCPTHYRPVCGASKMRSYMYRAFNNGCYLDMVNCRGDEDSGYVEVSLEFCQRHLMKNIFKETS